MQVHVYVYVHVESCGYTPLLFGKINYYIPNRVLSKAQLIDDHDGDFEHARVIQRWGEIKSGSTSS